MPFSEFLDSRRVQAKELVAALRKHFAYVSILWPFTEGGTYMEDEVILDLYFARNEQAITETDRKYGRYCFTLANTILNNTEDAEETVSDTYLKAWDTIPPKRPCVFKMFLAKITRNLAFSRWRSYTAEKRGVRRMSTNSLIKN